ncbi:unnamed protein product [Oikopleura dioica]|uniref:Uncharacterized protein n=1 Tax=Oikopleura dioica TaxID=34765 RepID=E4XUF3_OIKDI|nr:unnamed protein product [Oikopleura dioica]
MTGPVLSGNYEALNNFQYKKVNAEFQIAAATLSMGPVRFGDQKGNFNWMILSKCCRNDGVILKPDVPAAPIDADLAGLGNRQSGLGKGEEIRWQTYAEIEMEFFDDSDTENDLLTNNYVLLHKTSTEFALPLATLRGANAHSEFYYIQSQPVIVSDACFEKKSSDTILFAPQPEYSLYTFAEITLLKNKKFAFIGDISKIVGISSQRFKKFVNNNNGGSFTFSIIPTSANLVEGAGRLEDDMLELSACYDGALIQSRESFFVKYERDANFSFNADSKGFRCDSPDTCYKAPCSCPNSCESCYDIPNDGCATRWDSCENEVERSNNCPDGTFIESPGTEDGFQCAAQPKCVAKDECVTTTTEPPTTTLITTTTLTNVCNDPEISDQCLAECRLNYLECRANCDSQILQQRMCN